MDGDGGSGSCRMESGETFVTTGTVGTGAGFGSVPACCRTSHTPAAPAVKPKSAKRAKKTVREDVRPPFNAVTKSPHEAKRSSIFFVRAFARVKRIALDRSTGISGGSRPTTFIMTTGSPVENTLANGTSPVTSSWNRTASEY